jgi:DNA-binding transcriptional LysR family regulator
MTLVQLRHLIALAECGSFSKAAAAVHLTQPALSRSIKALEDELGQRLVDRVGRRTDITPMGRDVLERARQLVADAQDLEARSRWLAEGRLDVLRLGLGSGPGALLMTPLLLEVATRHPQWKVEVERGATDQLVQHLRARVLDALVVDLRSLATAPDLQIDGMCELAGAFLVRRGHPLLARRGLRFADLRAYPLASTPLSHGVAMALVQRYGPQAHPDQAVNLRCNEVASLVDVAQRSDTVLLTIRAAAPQLVELPLQPPLDTPAQLGLVTLTRRTEPPALALVRRLMNERLVDAAPARPRKTAGQANAQTLAPARKASARKSTKARTRVDS